MKIISLVFAMLFVPSAFAFVDSLSAQNMATSLLLLMAVVALIFAVLKMIKKMRGSASTAKSNIEVVAQLPLGQKERILLLKVNHEQLLVGVTASQINLLKTLESAVQIKETDKLTVQNTKQLRPENNANIF